MSTTAAYPDVSLSITQLSFVPENISGAPNWRFKAKGGSATSVTVDTSGAGVGRDDANLKNAPDDFLNNLAVYFATGALAGKLYDIVDFTEASGTATITTSTLAATPSAGDVFYVLGVLGMSNVSLSPKLETLEREFISMSLTKAPVKKGSKSWEGTFDAEVYGLKTPLGDGTTYVKDRTAQLLGGYGSARAYSGCTLLSGSSTTVLKCNAVTTFTVGDLVMVNGEIREIASIDTVAKTITLTTALSSAPAAAVVVYGAEEWTPYNHDQRTYTLAYLEDDQLTECYGGTLALKVGGAWGEYMKWGVSFSGGSWVLEDGFHFEGLETGQAPIEILVGDSFFGTTPLCLNSFEFDAALDLQEVNDICGGRVYRVRGADSSLKCVWRDTSAVPKNVWEQLDTLTGMIVGVGGSQGNAFAIKGQAQPQDIAGTDINSTKWWDSSFLLRDAYDSLTHTPPKLYRF